MKNKWAMVIVLLLLIFFTSSHANPIIFSNTDLTVDDTDKIGFGVFDVDYDSFFTLEYTSIINETYIAIGRYDQPATEDQEVTNRLVVQNYYPYAIQSPYHELSYPVSTISPDNLEPLVYLNAYYPETYSTKGYLLRLVDGIFTPIFESNPINLNQKAEFFKAGGNIYLAYQNQTSFEIAMFNYSDNSLIPIFRLIDQYTNISYAYSNVLATADNIVYLVGNYDDLQDQSTIYKLRIEDQSVDILFSLNVEYNVLDIDATPFGFASLNYRTIDGNPRYFLWEYFSDRPIQITNLEGEYRFLTHYNSMSYILASKTIFVQLDTLNQDYRYTWVKDYATDPNYDNPEIFWLDSTDSEFVVAINQDGDQMLSDMIQFYRPTDSYEPSDTPTGILSNQSILGGIVFIIIVVSSKNRKYVLRHH